MITAVVRRKKKFVRDQVGLNNLISLKDGEAYKYQLIGNWVRDYC
jgi:hypothetical protein